MKKREMQQARMSDQLVAAISLAFVRMSSISTTQTSRSEKEGRPAIWSSERDESRISQSRVSLVPLRRFDDAGSQLSLSSLYSAVPLEVVVTAKIACRKRGEW